MNICSLRGVGQTYGANLIFENITWQIPIGERIGLIGRNGEGKTTLLHLLAGISVPAKGTVSWKKGSSQGILQQQPDIKGEVVAVSILYQAFSETLALKEKMSGMEEAMASESDMDKLMDMIDKYGKLQEQFQEIGGYEMDAQVRKVASGVMIDDLLEKTWQQLSGGERTKFQLAKLLLYAPDLLLLDEPTNHLDIAAIEWLTDFIRQYHGTVVIVSHDRYFLDETVTSIAEMDQGELICYQTNYSDYVKEREERLMLEFQQYQDQQKKIKKMKATIKRLKEWANQATPPNAGLHRRAKSMEKALDRLELRKKPVLEQKQIDLQFLGSNRSGKDVVVMENVHKRVGNRELFKDVSLHVRYPERVAIVGENGSGKSTLLKLILHQEQADEGIVQMGSNVSIGFLSQHLLEVDEQDRIIDAFRKEVKVTEGKARSLLAKFLFLGDTVFQKAASLSGGEKMRLRLAQLVHQQHNLLVLDEPTNHLDIDAKEVLEDALENFSGTIIVVSHDRYFLNKLFPVTYRLASKQLTKYEGNYSYARRKWSDQR
ncbi:ribosomal protection-like ABC-F family protein [Virgibacillus halophilus]